MNYSKKILVFLLLACSDGYDSFMYVDKDSIIHDPSKVLDIEGKKYIDFKNELLEFAKEHDIMK